MNDVVLVAVVVGLVLGWQHLRRRYPGLGPGVRKGLDLVSGPLAGLWVLCLLLTLADWWTPLEFNNAYLAAAAHWGIWGLVFFAGRHWGWPQRWALNLWASTVVVGFLALVNSWMGIFGIPGMVVVLFGIQFFAPVQRWQTTYTYYQRGAAQVVDQRKNAPFGENKHRRVRQLLLPGWRWVQQELPYRGEGTPPERPAGAGWEWVGLKPDEHRLDSATQGRLAILRRIEQNRRWAQECAQQRNEPDAAPAPPGANTLSLLLDGDLWRSRSCQDTAIHTVVATWEPARRSGQHDLVVEAYPFAGSPYRSLHLTLYGVTGPGTYRLGTYDPATRTTNASFLRVGDDATGSLLSRPAFRVTIQRLDTTARIVAGTFGGEVARNNAAAPNRIQQGRFNVRYISLPRYP